MEFIKNFGENIDDLEEGFEKIIKTGEDLFNSNI